jgi:lysophospholipase L1-like esterase
MGGFTSAEVLIKFLLDSIDSDPDMIILYHAYNDLGPSLTSNFKSDYSHARRNLGERYHLFKWASKMPYISFALPNFLLNLLLPQNIKHGILSAISKGSISLDDEFNGLDTYRRNIKNLIHVCQASGIKVIISTYCHFLYPQAENNKSHQKYRAGVLEENDVMRELASEHELPLVDNFNLVPYEEKYFVDSVHFSPHGMHEIAKNISKPIIEYLHAKSF